MKHIFSLAAVAFLGFASNSAIAASPTGKDFYGQIYVGGTLTNDTRWADGRFVVPGLSPASAVLFNIGGDKPSKVRNRSAEFDIGYNIGASFGGWVNQSQRMEISVGYLSQGFEFGENNRNFAANSDFVYRTTATERAALTTARTANAGVEAATAALETATEAAEVSRIAIVAAARVHAPFLAAITAATARDTAAKAAVTAAAAAVTAAQTAEAAAAATALTEATTAGTATLAALVAVRTSTASVVLERETTDSSNNAITGDLSVIPVIFKNQFYPLTAFTGLLPSAHQPYFGFGVGVGFWTFDAPGLDDSFASAISFIGTLSAGYDFYLSGLKDFGMSMPGGIMGEALESTVIGIGYEFSYSRPAIKRASGDQNTRLLQNNHSLLFTARYEF